MFPIWVYVAVAFALAVTAFALGHLIPGLGVPFVALTTTLWTAWSVSRQRRSSNRNG